MSYRGKREGYYGSSRRKKPKRLSNRKANTLSEGKGYNARNRLEQDISAKVHRTSQGEQGSSEESCSKVNYLSQDTIEKIHHAIITQTHDDFPECPHVLSPSALKNALELPQTSLYGQELYPTLFEKSAVLVNELVRGHPFEAANKRTGYMCAVAFLDANGYDLKSNSAEIERFTSQIAMDKLSLDQITGWLTMHSKKKD